MKLCSAQFVAAVAVFSSLAVPCLAQEGYAIYHGSYSGPVEKCQPALPAYEASFRKRPLAIQNEGTVTAFVTCAFVWDKLAESGGGQVPTDYDSISIWFTNNGTGAATVSCTAVYGREMQTTLYSTQTAMIGSGNKALISWSDQINFDDYRAVAVSCAIPSGVGINESMILTIRPDYY